MINYYKIWNRLDHITYTSSVILIISLVSKKYFIIIYILIVFLFEWNYLKNKVLSIYIICYEHYKCYPSSGLMLSYWATLGLCSFVLIYHKYLNNYHQNDDFNYDVYNLWIYFGLICVNLLLTCIPEKSILSKDQVW